MTTRRVFMMQSVAGATALASGFAVAAAPVATIPELAETAANAKALNYVANAASSKNAKFKVGSHCANCALFQGKPGDALGPCPLFAGKQVSAKGWCNAYSKKA